MLAGLLEGFSIALTLKNCALLLGGTLLGILFGALPGISSSMGCAVLIPLTFGMEPASGLILLAGIYCGSTYGGSISACLLNTPGTPASAATTIEGFPMTRSGHGGEALIESCTASLWGGLIGSVALVFLSPVVGKLSLKFGPQENALMAIFGLTIIVSLSREGNLLKGGISGCLGLLIACIGMDVSTAYPRFTFGNVSLLSGVSTIPCIVGLYSLSQILVSTLEDTSVVLDKSMLNKLDTKFTLKDLVRYPMTYIKSSVIGTVVGIIPAAGGNIAGYMAYNEAKRSSRHPELYGTGCREGIAATESANNAVCGGSLIPMLTLGIPGNSVAAILMGGLMIQGLQPGYALFSGPNSRIIYAFFAGFILAQPAFALFGFLGAKQFAKIVKTPKGFLLSGICVLCVVGAFAVSNVFFDVYVMLIFGVLGYFLRLCDFDISAVVLGFLLGNLAENGFVQAFTINMGNMIKTLLTFVQRPICLLLIALSAISIVSPMVKKAKTK